MVLPKTWPRQCDTYPSLVMAMPKTFGDTSIVVTVMFRYHHALAKFQKRGHRELASLDHVIKTTFSIRGD